MTKRTRKWEEKFLAVLEATGNVSQAAEAAGTSRQTVFDHQRSDTEFANKCLDAVYAAADIILAEAMRRAVQGEQIPVYSRGSVVGNRTRTSDTLLIFVHETLLKQAERTRQRAQAHRPRPPKPPVELVVADHVGVDRPLREWPAIKVARAS